MVHAPIALLPNSFPESHFNQACELALIFNDLVDRVSLDSKFLQDTLESQLKAIGGQDSDVLENLMTAVRKRVEVLRGIQSEHDELEAKFFEEKAKYQKLIAALYSKRYDIVTGAVEVDGAKEEDAMDQTDDTDRLIVIMAGALVQPTSFPSTVSGENKVRSKRSGRTKETVGIPEAANQVTLPLLTGYSAIC